MEQLLCHLCGDYILQNHWMANKKTSSSLAAAIHAALYTLPFLLLTHSPVALSIICGTHFVIDRWRLARLWVNFWGVGQPGFFGYGEPAPLWLAVWLLIIVDNTAHLTINYFALKVFS